MITLLAALSRLFLQTPKHLIVWTSRAPASNSAWRLSFQKLVHVDAGTRREARTFFYWKVVETGAIVAKKHQDIVEGLEMSRLTENRARRGLQPSHWKEMPQTERV